MTRTLFVRSLVSTAIFACACGGTGGADPGSETPGNDSGGSSGASGSAGMSSVAGATAAGGGAGANGGASTLGGSGGMAMCTTQDDDADTLANVIEGDGAVDTDGDGTPDSTDTDSDNDSWLDIVEAAACGGPARTDVCAIAFDSDMDGVPDFRDLDSDNDGIPDADEMAFDPDGSKCCRTKADCDGDNWPDITELAAGTDPTDPSSKPPDSFLYFVLPYQAAEQTKDFSFSTGIRAADIEFLIDTTASAQPAIDNIAQSITSTILPAILNGDATQSPPIPAIPGAWLGVASFRDVPWSPYGMPGDDVFLGSFAINGSMVSGNVASPQGTPPMVTPPASVTSILGSLQASGGGDGPEAWGQALSIAITGTPYQVTGGGTWSYAGSNCTQPMQFGAACFRPDVLPVFVIVTDAPMHNGPQPGNDYDPTSVMGALTYDQTVQSVLSMGAKVVGVPVNTGAPGAARADLTDLATKTNSVYHDPAFGGSDQPLVTAQDTDSGDVSSEIVGLIGKLAGAGLHDVTTTHESYDCPGNVDCDGDGTIDPAFHNPIGANNVPIDAGALITAVVPVPVTDPPIPYGSLDATTFYDVPGAAEVSFRVHAQNETLNPSTLLVLRATVRVRTPSGQALGGPDGIKSVFILIPRNPHSTHLGTSPCDREDSGRSWRRSR